MMSGRKRKAIEEKRKLLRVLMECEDSENDAEAAKLCRSLYRDFSVMDMPIALAEEKIALGEEALSALKSRKYHLAQICLGRIEELNRAVSEKTGSKKHMGLLEKAKSKLPWSKDRSEGAVLKKEEADTGQKIFELQKKIGGLYDELSSLTVQVEEKAQRCAAISPDSSEYKKLRQQAAILLPRMRAIEQQLKLHTKVMENSSRYHAMLQTGRTTFELKSLFPDLGRSEAMMEWIAEETQELSENTSDMAGSIRNYEDSINMSMEGKEVSDTKEFDVLVQRKKQTIKAETPEKSREAIPDEQRQENKEGELV